MADSQRFHSSGLPCQIHTPHRSCPAWLSCEPPSSGVCSGRIITKTKEQITTGGLLAVCGGLHLAGLWLGCCPHVPIALRKYSPVGTRWGRTKTGRRYGDFTLLLGDTAKSIRADVHMSNHLGTVFGCLKHRTQRCRENKMVNIFSTAL